MEYDFKIRYEIASPDRVRAYVNDVYIGALTYKNVLIREQTQQERERPYHERARRPREVRLTFRAKGESFKHFLRPPYDQDVMTAESALADYRVRNQLTPIVLHAALKNFYRGVCPVEAAEEQAAEDAKYDRRVVKFEEDLAATLRALKVA